MRDIGNRHDHAPAFALGQGLCKHRIIEIFGGFTVNGHQRNIAQIFALAEVLTHHNFFRNLRCFIQHSLRKLKGQIMLA